jgi:hypothetical protein
MRETLELLDDLLAEGAGAVDDNDLLELGVVAVLRSKFPDAKDIKWVGGTAPYDIQIGNEKWEVKQFKPDGTLARIGSGKSSSLDSNTYSRLLTSIASAIVRNLPFLESLAQKNANLKGALDWMKYQSSGSKQNRAQALAEMWITSSTMESIKAGDFGRHLITIHEVLMDYIGIDDESDAKFDVIVKQQGTPNEENVGTVSDRQLQLKVKPAIQGSSGQTPGESKNLAAAADVFNPIDDVINGKERGFIQGLKGEMWVEIFRDVAGVDGFIGIDAADSRPTGIRNFEVTFDRVTMFTLDELTIHSIDTKRPVPLPTSRGKEISIEPNTSIVEDVGGQEITVTVNSTERVGSASSAKVYSLVRKISGTNVLPLTDPVADLKKILDEPGVTAADMVKAIRKVATQPSEPFYRSFNTWLKANRNPSKREAYDFIVKSSADYLNSLPTLTGDASITQPVPLNTGRSRPGPRLVETLSLLEDLLTP